jgi:hypothetical protein
MEMALWVIIGIVAAALAFSLVAEGSTDRRLKLIEKDLAEMKKRLDQPEARAAAQKSFAERHAEARKRLGLSGAQADG